MIPGPFGTRFFRRSQRRMFFASIAALPSMLALFVVGELQGNQAPVVIAVLVGGVGAGWNFAHFDRFRRLIDSAKGHSTRKSAWDVYDPTILSYKRLAILHVTLALLIAIGHLVR